MELNQLGRQRCRNMRKFLCVFFMCMAAVDCFAVPVVVKYIIDGDTFVGDVLIGKSGAVESVSVRLRNVDTPEIHGDCDSEIKMALRAKQRLAELIPIGTTIEIKNVKDDKYVGRIDANVFDLRGVDVGQILVNEKLGRPYNGGKRKSWCE